MPSDVRQRLRGFSKSLVVLGSIFSLEQPVWAAAGAAAANPFTDYQQEEGFRWRSPHSQFTWCGNPIESDRDPSFIQEHQEMNEIERRLFYSLPSQTVSHNILFAKLSVVVRTQTGFRKLTDWVKWCDERGRVSDQIAVFVSTQTHLFSTFAAEATTTNPNGYKGRGLERFGADRGLSFREVLSRDLVKTARNPSEALQKVINEVFSTKTDHCRDDTRNRKRGAIDIQDSILDPSIIQRVNDDLKKEDDRQKKLTMLEKNQKPKTKEDIKKLRSSSFPTNFHHTEQWLMLYLGLNKPYPPSNPGGRDRSTTVLTLLIQNLIDSRFGELYDPKIVSVVLQLHSKLDVCSNCTPTLSAFCTKSNGTVFSSLMDIQTFLPQYFDEPAVDRAPAPAGAAGGGGCAAGSAQDAHNDRSTVPFLILASARVSDYTDKRRIAHGHDDHDESPVDLSTLYPLYIQIPMPDEPLRRYGFLAPLSHRHLAAAPAGGRAAGDDRGGARRKLQEDDDNDDSSGSAPSSSGSGARAAAAPSSSSSPSFAVGSTATKPRATQANQGRSRR